MNYLIIILCIKTFKNVVIMDLVENVLLLTFVYLVYENEMGKGKKWSPRHNGSIKKIGLWP